MPGPPLWRAGHPASGGLLGVGLSNFGIGWQVKLALVVIPAITVVILSIGVKFPPTERMAAGISMGQMFKELLNPLFVILFFSLLGLRAANLLAVVASVVVVFGGGWLFYKLVRVLSRIQMPQYPGR